MTKERISHARTSFYQAEKPRPITAPPYALSAGISTTVLAMSKLAALEPALTRFYAPLGLFSDEDLRQISAEYLGYVIVSPGGSFRYRVTSGPLCRLY